KVRVRKVAFDLGRCRGPEAGRPIGGEHVDRSGPEVGRKEKDPVNIGAERQTFVDRVRRVVDGENRLITRGQPARPRGNRSILGGPDECGRGEGRLRHEKGRGRVPHEAGRRSGRRLRRIIRVNRLTGGGGHTATGERKLDL